MSENTSRIYLKMGDIEISIEGSPAYVSEQYNQMAKDLNLQQKLQGTQEAKPKTKKTTQSTKTQKQKPKEQTKKSTTNEWLSNLPQGIKSSDIILLAGYLNQLNSKDHTFRIKDVNNTLKENGIKVSNPSSLINHIVKKKKVINLVKKVKGQNFFQITKEGEKAISNLIKKS